MKYNMKCKEMYYIYIYIYIAADTVNGRMQNGRNTA